MPTLALKTMAKKAGKPYKRDAERYWNQAKQSVTKHQPALSGSNKWRYVMAIVKRRLGGPYKKHEGIVYKSKNLEDAKEMLRRLIMARRQELAEGWDSKRLAAYMQKRKANLHSGTIEGSRKSWHMAQRLLQRARAVVNREKKNKANEAYCPVCDEEKGSYLYRANGFHQCAKCGANMQTSKDSYKAAAKAKPWQHGTPRKTVKEYWSEDKLNKYKDKTYKHMQKGHDKVTISGKFIAGDKASERKGRHMLSRILQRATVSSKLRREKRLKEYMSQDNFKKQLMKFDRTPNKWKSNIGKRLNQRRAAIFKMIRTDKKFKGKLAAENMEEKMSPENLRRYHNKFNSLIFKASKYRARASQYSKLPDAEKKKFTEKAKRADQLRAHMRTRLQQRQAAIAKKKAKAS